MLSMLIILFTTHFAVAESHLAPELWVTQDFMTNSGGVHQQARTLTAIDFYLESDVSKFTPLNGDFQFHFGHLDQYGNPLSVGDVQYASNIDMPGKVDRVIDLWYDHKWNNRFKTKFGIQDLNYIEFNFTRAAYQFLNGGFGTDQALAYSGVNGPSIWPLTGLGIRGLYELENGLSLRAGAYDANPGGSRTYKSFHSDLNREDGVFSIAEIAFKTNQLKAAVAYWLYSTDHVHINNESKHSRPQGAYWISQYKFKNLNSVFLRYGWSNPSTNIIQNHLSVGGVMKGLLSQKRFLDELGLGVSMVHFSNDYETTESFDYRVTGHEEVAYELYYQYRFLKGFFLRPDLQLITTPAGRTDIKSAWVGALRTIIILN